MKNYQKKASLSLILLIVLCNSSTAHSQYLDIFSASGDDTLVLFRVKAGANEILNPTIIVYSSSMLEVFVSGVKILNATGKLILNITTSQRVSIFSDYKNITFWAEKITSSPIYEHANFIEERMLLVAFSTGYIQAVIAVFVISPVLSYLKRRKTL